MKKLSKDLKRILAGLARQDAGESLSRRDTMAVPGAGVVKQSRPGSRTSDTGGRASARRIALISDGRGLGAPLDYVIDACTRQEAKIDVLVHGAVDPANIAALEGRIREAGLDCGKIQLGTQSLDKIVDYVYNHAALMFLVAMPDDRAVRALIDDLGSKRRARLPVPLVLVEERPVSRPRAESVA
jgi:hypothetical protein